MQVDMHYYGTYAMARAAGLNDEACRIVATAAEFVDDNAGHESLFSKDEGHVSVTATAHHSVNKKNLDPDDQRLVWVPYHFLPGAQGDSFEEKLICRKDSPIANEMLEHYLSFANKRYACHLVGIAAHVYSDTFAHYGFSGISSQLNYIDESSIEFDTELPADARSYIFGKFAAFKRKLESDVAEALSSGLGHGAAHTYPDRPYLKWQFNYEDGRKSGHRSNPDTYLEACEKLHNFFIRFAEANPDVKAREATPFADMKDTIVHIINACKPMDERIKLWQGAGAGGLLYQPGGEIPPYNADDWLDQLNAIGELGNGADALDFDAYKFLQAAAMHRSYVLRDLLPDHGLLVR